MPFGKIRSVFTFLGFSLFSMTLIAGLSSNGWTKSEFSQAQIKPVESNQVCMVTNKFMGSEQIPVSVDGKTYYGCCQGCVSKLKNEKKAQSSTDPLTGEAVDKASAFTVALSGSNNVLYFKSERTYKDYLSQSVIPAWFHK